MRRVVSRVFGAACALMLAFAFVVPVSSQSSDSVTVTGAIVGAPLSISIPDTVVTFGNMDYLATSQGGSPSAVGFLADSNNGALWISQTPVVITIVSPAVWSSTVCVTSSTGLPATAFRILPSVPTTTQEANTAFGQSGASVAESCTTPSAWIVSQTAGGPTVHTRYLGAWVQQTMTPAPVTGTITFSVTTGG